MSDADPASDPLFHPLVSDSRTLSLPSSDLGSGLALPGHEGASGRCTGCGVHLQCRYPFKPGFVAPFILDQVQARTPSLDPIDSTTEPADGVAMNDPNNPDPGTDRLCHRCYQYRYRDRPPPWTVSVPPEQFAATARVLRELDVLLVCVVDLFDWEASVIPDLLEHVGPYHPIIVVGNKLDLAPPWPVRPRAGAACALGGVSSGSTRGLERWVQAAVSRLGWSHVTRAVTLVSARTGLGIRGLMDAIDRYRGDRDVYVVGRTNSGKSSLVNALLGAQSAARRRRLTVSRFPGTTYDRVGFPLLPKSRRPRPDPVYSGSTLGRDDRGRLRRARPGERDTLAPAYLYDTPGLEEFAQIAQTLASSPAVAAHWRACGWDPGAVDDAGTASGTSTSDIEAHVEAVLGQPRLWAGSAPSPEAPIQYFERFVLGRVGSGPGRSETPIPDLSESQPLPTPSEPSTPARSEYHSVLAETDSAKGEEDDRAVLSPVGFASYHNHLLSRELAALHPFKRLQPQVHTLEAASGIWLGGLARIEFLGHWDADALLVSDEPFGADWSTNAFDDQDPQLQAFAAQVLDPELCRTLLAYARPPPGPDGAPLLTALVEGQHHLVARTALTPSPSPSPRPLAPPQLSALALLRQIYGIPTSAMISSPTGPGSHSAAALRSAVVLEPERVPRPTPVGPVMVAAFLSGQIPTQASPSILAETRWCKHVGQTLVPPLTWERAGALPGWQDWEVLVHTMPGLPASVDIAVGGLGWVSVLSPAWHRRHQSRGRRARNQALQPGPSDPNAPPRRIHAGSAARRRIARQAEAIWRAQRYGVKTYTLPGGGSAAGSSPPAYGSRPLRFRVRVPGNTQVTLRPTLAAEWPPPSELARIRRSQRERAKTLFRSIPKDPGLPGH